jgi:hypothetical protein
LSSKETPILSATALTNSLYTEVAVFLVGTKIAYYFEGIRFAKCYILRNIIGGTAQRSQ